MVRPVVRCVFVYVIEEAINLTQVSNRADWDLGNTFINPDGRWTNCFYFHFNRPKKILLLIRNMLFWRRLRRARIRGLNRQQHKAMQLRLQEEEIIKQRCSSGHKSDATGCRQPKWTLLCAGEGAVHVHEAAVSCATTTEPWTVKTELRAPTSVQKYDMLFRFAAAHWGLSYSQKRLRIRKQRQGAFRLSTARFHCSVSYYSTVTKCNKDANPFIHARGNLQCGWSSARASCMQ